MAVLRMRSQKCPKSASVVDPWFRKFAVSGN